MKYTLKKESLEFTQISKHKLFIDNEWTAANGDGHINVTNPATEEVLSSVGLATEADVDKAVRSARVALKQWRKISPMDKERLLNKLADKMEAHLEVLAEILTLENGKLIAQAKSEIKGAVNTFRYYAGWATKIEGETLDVSLRQAPGKKNFAFTKREPVGVVAAIVPWNFPISIAVWKLAPALAAGCAVVLKPSEVTPLSTLYLAKLIGEVDFPKGLVNVITGDGKTGAALTTHSGISKITFTGSTEVGKLIGKAAMDSLTDVSLELGGKSPGIVFDDADMASAAKGLAAGIFRNGGQVCVAGSRLYIHKKSFDNLLADICAEGEKMKISHGFDPEADLGPLVSKAHLTRVTKYIETGKEESQICTGGHRPDGKGFYVAPTVFKSEDNNKVLISEEVFGPVLVAVPFTDMDDALTMANNSNYGLSSTIWTKDISRALQCIDGMDAGWVFVNGPARSDPNFPMGGNKQSGIGRELGKVGLYNYTKLKSVNIIY